MYDKYIFGSSYFETNAKISIFVNNPSDQWWEKLIEVAKKNYFDNLSFKINNNNRK